MLITKVELEDIKSHRNSVFEFQPGTTAITGANGAGKTSIIEAIAWALFDFLEYNRDDFVRRSAKKGAVRVTFKSGLDNKTYTIYRDTAGKHWVYDEETKTRIIEQNANVIGFLRQHLQVEPGTNLKELYRAAIGVPQGTFTAVFLDNATNRKAVFDRLLKVEEYRESAKKLGETVNLIKEKQSAIKLRLAVGENELAKFNETELEHKEIQSEIAALERELILRQTEIETRQKLVGEFETAKQQLETTQNALRERQNEQQNALREQAAVQSNLEAAQKAVVRLGEVEPDYQKFVRAENDLKTLEKDRVERDKLKAEQTQIDKNLINAKAENQSLKRDLERSIEAKREIETLAPKIVEQEKLENEYKNLLQNRAEAASAQNRANELDREITAKRTEYKELSEKIKDSEKGAEAENNIAKLEAQKKSIENDLRETDQALARLEILKPQYRTIKTEKEKQQEAATRIEIEITALETHQARAAQVGELSEVETSLVQKIANLRATIELDARFQREVKNGVCPILPDRCLNLRETETLNGYLTGKTTANTEALQKFERERKQVLVDLQAARDAEKNLAKLQTLREQLTTSNKQTLEREINLQSLRDEIVSLKDFTAEKQNNLRVEKSKIELELRVLHEAARKHAALEGLRRQIQNLKDEGTRLSDEQKKLKEIGQKLVEIEENIKINQNRLRELNNPKARAETSRREASRETDLREQIDRLAKTIEKFEVEKQTIETELGKFASLDEKLGQVRSILDQTRQARDDFVRNQAVAEKLPEYQTAFEKLTVEVERLNIAVEEASSLFETARQNYNVEKHAQEKIALDAARTAEAATKATLLARTGRENQLRQMLEHLREVRERMHADLQEAEKLRQVFETTDYIRETLKKAAPHVGEILRFEIAREATNMFREITGEIGRSLKWTEDYEILLDENGYQRPFANFSGGEQMAAALSVRLSLLTQLSDVRVAFFDEPTTNLDRERRERLAQQIGQIRNFNQLFVISHDDTFESEVDFNVNVGAAEQV